MRAVISVHRGAPRRPDRQGPGPGRVPGDPRRRPSCPGDQLPPIRRVAEELMMSPTTVSAAWQLLARSGTIRSDGRRGTTVAPTARGGERYTRALRHESPVTPRPVDRHPRQRPAAPARAGAVRTDRPDDAEQLPRRPRARRAAARCCRRDWPYAADDLLVVDGAMDALDLVTPGAAATRATSCSSRTPGSLPCSTSSRTGVSTSSACRSTRRASTWTPSRPLLPRRPAAVVIQPRGQNPTGVSMSPDPGATTGCAARGTRLHRHRGRLERPDLDVGRDQPRSVDPRPGAAHPQLQQVARAGPADRRR